MSDTASLSRYAKADPMSSARFVLGGNVPWLDCGWDFGPPPRGFGARRHDWAAVEAELVRLRGLGLRVLRWWVMAAGINYPRGHLDAYARRDRGRSGGHWHWRAAVVPPRLNDGWIEDFTALCVACQRAGVQLMPSLMSFEWFLPARGLGRGRAPLVFGDDARDVRGAVERFLQATLQPLLEASRPHNAIFAWEVVNEPDWVVQGGPRLGPALVALRVPDDAMAQLLLAGMQRIVDAGFVASVGFADMRAPWLPPRAMQQLADWASQGKYLHQHHHYPSLLGSWRLPPAALSPVQPVLLGEMPSAPGRWDGHNLPWRDRELRGTERDPQGYLAARIALAAQRGFAGALLWSTPTSLTGPGQDRRSRWTTARWTPENLGRWT